MKNQYKILMAMIGLFASVTAGAQTYPTQVIRLVIPYATGGSSDVIGRAIGQKLSVQMGQPVVLDNRPGANSIVGADIVAKSKPDGYTLLLATLATLVHNQILYKDLPYNVARDFAPITQICAYPFAIVASNTLSADTLPALVALAKQKPGQISYGTTGNGSTGHLGGALLESAAGIKLTHVAYKGTAPATLDLLAGRVQLMVTGLLAIQTHVQAGKLKLIAVGSNKRAPSYPKLSTISESYPGIVLETWYGIVGRAGTASPIIARLNREIILALEQPDVRKLLETQGFDVVHGTPEAMSALIAEETLRIGKVARDSNIQLE